MIAGWTREFDFGLLDAAFQAVRGGARLVATNTDRTYPTPKGPIPGGGAIVAALERASGATAEIAGKPHEPMAGLVRELIATDPGTVAAGTPADIVVGDRPATDGRFAVTLGVPFALVTTGVTGPDDVPDDPPVSHVGADLTDLVARLGGA